MNESMYLLLNMVIFHCHFSFRGCKPTKTCLQPGDVSDTRTVDVSPTKIGGRFQRSFFLTKNQKHVQIQIC